VSLSEFGLRDRETCSQFLTVYDSIAHPFDRHRRDAAIFKLWSDHALPTEFNTAIEGVLESRKTKLTRVWSGGNTFSPTSWDTLPLPLT
jgi:hypothetical protein